MSTFAVAYLDDLDLDQRLVTASLAATRLGFTRRTVQRWASSGRLSPVACLVDDNRTHLYREIDVRRAERDARRAFQRAKFATDRPPMPDLPPRPKAVEDRFWTKVEKTDLCWLWTGTLLNSGYGQFRPDPQTRVVAHRWAYEAEVGPIPAGKQLDHICERKMCVRPGHLQPVTASENLRLAIIRSGRGNPRIGAHLRVAC